MSEKSNVVVVGLGEVGKPLFELVSQFHNVVGVDIAPPTEIPVHVDVMHVCIPFAIRDFISETLRYMEIFKPDLTIVNSTVAVGTTRAIAERSGKAVVNSPIRGKHARMLDDLCFYAKFIGAIDSLSGSKAVAHFKSVGLKTRTLTSPESSELAKLTETTYFGLLIAWAQEVERYCDQVGANYDEVVSIYEEIKFFPPVKYFSGVIGGHCVMPNIDLLGKLSNSKILNAIKSSNVEKVNRDSHKEKEDMQPATKAQALRI